MSHPNRFGLPQPHVTRYVPCPRCGHQWDEHDGEVIEPHWVCGELLEYNCDCCELRLPELRWVSELERAVIAEAEHIAGGSP